MADNNPRPMKRAKMEYPTNNFPMTSSPLTPLPSSYSSSPMRPTNETPLNRSGPVEYALRPLPPAVLLVSLPGLLAHPPTHRNYAVSLQLSLTALRKCLIFPDLTPEMQCRAWMGLAEVGMNVIGGGFTRDQRCVWARDVEAEVGKALSKGVSDSCDLAFGSRYADDTAIIAQKHPSLRLFKHHIALLQARFSHWQNKTKFARTYLRNLIASFQPSDPAYIIYSTHLALISSFMTPASTPAATTTTSSTDTTPLPSPQLKTHDIQAALAAVQDLETVSIQLRHPKITLLAYVLRLRVLAASEQWSEIPQVLSRVEAALGLSYEPCLTPKPSKPPAGSQVGSNIPPNGTQNPATKVKRENEMFVFFENPYEACMALHILVIAVIYYTHVGDSAQVVPRLSHLHGMLDACALDKFQEGIVEVECGPSTPLVLQVTHPRILLLLGFLVSTIAKRDAVGRYPKRKLFAYEGVKACQTTYQLLVPLWSDMGNVDEIVRRLARLKADLLCELIAASIMRSEFDAAEENLNIVIAHTRTYDIFHDYAGRISLHHAHLAHALGHTKRAVECYRAASNLSPDGHLVGVVAMAGEISVRLADIQARKQVIMDVSGDSEESEKTKGKKRETEDDLVLEREIAEVHGMAVDVIERCRGMGAAVEAVGHVLEACIAPEILKAKSHLKLALNLATKSQDNHFRALVLAFIASQYMYTAGEHAYSMLQAIDQMGAGLGASSGKGEDGKDKLSVGNAPLRLWVGERLLELYKRSGQEAQAQKQAGVNAQFAGVVEGVKKRGIGGVS